jgi:tetratricopeptide (TPR) repeat protein
MAKWAMGLVLLIGLLNPDRAHAEEPLDGSNQVAAQQLAAQGFEAYKAGRYHAALELYRQALEAHPAAALYFNVARIHETKLSAPDKAIEYYRKVLQAPDVTEALVEKSLARIRVLTALLAQPNQPEGQAPPPKPAEPPEGQPPPAARQPRAAVEDGQETSQGSSQETIGYVVGISGLVAVGAGLGLGGWALLERGNARKTCDGDQCTTQDGVDSMNTAYDLITASTITLAVGGALSAVGLGMVLFAPERNPDDQDAATNHPATARTGLRLSIIPTSGGAQLQLAAAFF